MPYTDSLSLPSSPRTCVTPFLSMRKRLMIQFPLLRELSRPYVMVSVRMHLATSNCVQKWELRVSRIRY